LCQPYQSGILYAYTKQLLAYTVSSFLKVDFVLAALKMLIEMHGAELSDETLIHGDQGTHFTSLKYIQLV